jgi:hypothetical protein
VSVWEVLANEWCKSCLKEDDRKILTDGIAAAANGG